ncbi:MAG TPA: hypothetical protein VJA86_00370 [Candidatus Nanoarchaeia archaeon]|nr:hypothetical protein [Candidatus Nanoarchaeia archaeon]
MAEKKKFFKVEVPALKRQIDLFGTSLESFNNQTIKLDLTRILRGKSIEVTLRVNVSNGAATAVPIKLELLGFFIRRMLRTGIDYVEDSFSAKCKEESLRVKTFMITRKKVPRSVRKALRNAARSFVSEYIKEKSFDEIVEDIVFNKLQKSLSLTMKKIYPLALCEIRIIYKEKTK